jgi:hypothetical protein
MLDFRASAAAVRHASNGLGLGAMADTLEVAHQRKLIETLQRDGHSTYDAEIRLRTMVESLTSFRGYQAGIADRAGKRPAAAKHE